jgi:site-specific recombinase XerD
MGVKFIKSKKFIGVYHIVLQDGTKQYYVFYKLNGRQYRTPVGRADQYITEQFAYDQRSQIINAAKFGTTAPLIKYRTKDGTTIKDIADKYITSRDLKPATIKKYEGIVKAISELIGNKTLKELTTDEITKLKNRLKTDGKAPKTINAYIEMINIVFNFAIKKGLFKEVNPCNDIDNLKVDNRRERFLSIEELATLKEALKNKPSILMFVELCLSTGGRLKTIVAICKKDINLSKKIITLQNLKAKNNYIGTITDNLLPMIKAHYGAMKNPNDKLFKSARSIQRPLQKILNRLFNEGLDTKDAKHRVVVHTLRHTFASHLAAAGVSLYTIKKLCDHKDIKDTARYAHLAPDNGLDAVKELWK